MSRTLRSFAITAVSATILLGAGRAQAVSSIDFVWLESGTPTLSAGTANVSAGTVHTGAIVLTLEGPFPILITISLLYDTFELDFVQAWEHSAHIPPAMSPYQYDPVTAGVQVDEANGVVNQLDWSRNAPEIPLSCEAVCSVTLTLGTIQFSVANPSGEPVFQDRDIQLGLFTPGVDGVFDIGGVVVPMAFGDAAVPEPTEALLLVAGLGFLAYAGRGSNR